MSFWEFLLWAFIVYCVYKVFTSGTVDKVELRRALVQGMRNGFNPTLDEIIHAIDQGDVKKARAAVVALRADINNPEHMK